jgi:PEP-CTERM motif-containing protein
MAMERKEKESMQPMKLRNIPLSILAAVGLLTAGSGASGAMVLPAGTAYQAPAGGTLVVDELYGSNNDGQGSWTSHGDPNITVNPESITVVLDNEDSPDKFISLVTLPFNIIDTSYVIDIGLESWTSDDVAPESSMLWIPASTQGVKYNYITNSTSALPEDSDATLTGKDSVSSLVFGQDVAQVVRLTATAGNDANPQNFAVIGTNPATTSAKKEGAAGVNGIFLTTAGGGAGPSTLEVSWFKVYTGVVDNSAPLSVVPEPASMALLGLGCLGVLKRRT